MIRIFKNRVLISSVLFLGTDLLGGFLIVAPILVFLRNQLEKSASALGLWPIITPSVGVDILVNDTQALAIFAASAILMYAVFTLLRSFLSGGIYNVIVSAASTVDQKPLRRFLIRCAENWPGFIKVSLFSILVYGLALFVGIFLGRLFRPFGIPFRIVFLGFIMLLGSTYLQVLKLRIVASGDTSLRVAIKSTRFVVSNSALRLVLGNLSVGIVGAIVAMILWAIFKAVREHNWTAFAAVLSVVLEQALVFTVCLVQAIRINFNNSVMTRSEDDSLGRTELG